MYVDRLTLDDFRGFEHLELQFERRVTLLVGVNGAGKTTVVDALTILLHRMHAIIARKGVRGPGMADEDVRLGAQYASCTIDVSHDDNVLDWRVSHTRRGVRLKRASHLWGLAKFAVSVQAQAEKSRWALPLAVKYGVTRVAVDIPIRLRGKGRMEPLAAYDDALTGASNSFRRFFEWFRERESIEYEERVRRSARYRDPQLHAVREAVSRLVPGFSDLRAQRSPPRMLVTKGSKELEVNQLSDGERALIALAGDLARRLALANPRAKSPLECEAIVLIDEVELHLHPGWQREVVDRLASTFPRCQFILTTHSPQVIASVPTSALRLLRDWQVWPAPVPTHGRDSNAILSELMQAGERPVAVAERLTKVERLIEKGHVAAARRALAELANEWSESTAEVVRLRTMLAFVEGSDAGRP